MTVPTCWARGILQLVEYAVGRGAARQAVLARLPLSLASLQDTEQRVPLLTYYDAVEAIADLLDDRYWGLNYIATVEPGALDAVGFLALSSRTLGEAVQRIIAHHRLMSDGETFTLEVESGRASFRFAPYGPIRPAHRLVTQMYAADCLLLPTRLMGAPIEILSFELMESEKSQGEEYRRRFGHVPRFGASANRWSFAAAALDWPMPRADPGLVAFFDRYLLGKADTLWPTGSRREQARRIVAETLPDPPPTPALVARRLGIGPRTLQRQLAAEGSTLAGIIEEVRRTRAITYLKRGLPTAEVSYLLGYAEPSAFQRAFKRWMGYPPLTWRERAAQSA